MNKDANLIDDIARMHDKFGLHPVIKTLAPEQLKSYLDFRISMIGEEFGELQDAFEYKDPEEVIDAIIDLIVFSIGTLDAFQVNITEAWNQVHQANMAKEPGIKKGRPNPFGFPDLIKPQDWQGPSHAGNHGLVKEALS